MKNLILKKHRCMLWKDELFDVKGSTKHTFLILKYTEVYRYSKTALRLHIWSNPKLAQLQKMGVIQEVIGLDEEFSIAYAKVANLPQIIALGEFKKRPHINGRWIKSRERILAHKILPYRPITLEGKK